MEFRGWRVDYTATIGEKWDSVEGDGWVKRMADEKIPMVEGGGKDVDSDLTRFWLRCWNVLEVQSMGLISIYKLRATK